MEKQRAPLSPQQRLFNLRQAESYWSKIARSISPEEPNLVTFTEVQLKLEGIRWEIENLTKQIPSAGPSPTTANGLNHDPQGRKPWRGK